MVCFVDTSSQAHFRAWSLSFILYLDPERVRAENEPIPWCAPDGLDEDGNPLPPRPYWSELDRSDYVTVSENFNFDEPLPHDFHAGKGDVLRRGAHPAV